MSKPSPLDDILAGLDEAAEHLEKNPLQGEPIQKPIIPSERDPERDRDIDRDR